MGSDSFLTSFTQGKDEKSEINNNEQGNYSQIDGGLDYHFGEGKIGAISLKDIQNED